MPRWPSGKVGFGTGGFRTRFHCDPPCMGPLHAGSSSGNASVGELVKPTLARPTQKGCKAGADRQSGRFSPACGRDLLGTIKNDTQALPEQELNLSNTKSWSVGLTPRWGKY
ncbi:hypothetical protein AVEN_202483-1 [Araneus ventricosus]|uniref:Uncharacterized protein n=1 Tax=Araneus ventricosus TaxID=182803 RepID=A0A4Y2MV79_ARAVE|nr:hypothetical protein AVEN_202483-1 [Araneus ventricosus]